MVLLSSCTKDFAEVNTNQLLPDAHQKTLDGLASGGLFPGFIQNIIPTRGPGQSTDLPNRYQIAFNLAGDNWAGYFSPGNSTWNDAKNYTNYYVIDGWSNYAFSTMVERVINPFMEIKAAMHDVEIASDKTLIYHKKDLASQSVFSVAQIIKIMGYHRTTDMFGPVPYSKIGAGRLTVPYDSQEQVYRSFFKELEEAVATLNEYLASGGTKILAEYDPVYQGDTSKWIKLGNSLMLRLAMRVRYVDSSLATEYATKAFNNSGGLLTNKEDVAKLQNNGRFNYFNSVQLLWKSYAEVKMGATIYSYLKGYDDPRIAKYFSKGNYNGKEDYYAVRSGITKLSEPLYKDFSNPNIEENTPTYWMKASEVKFLLAEAALFNIIPGNAQDYYNQGIALSFEENDLQIGNYLEAQKQPANYVDPKNSAYSIDAISNITKEWGANYSQEEHLEQIITQKYLAIYPDGHEAWTEWRRTGYPRIFKIPANNSNVGTQDINTSGTDGGMRRLPFPLNEYRLNSDNVNAAKAFLGGSDNAATNVWWDKKSKR
ncbi:hypothetical protein RCZ01_02270 [Capnocytophaga felis]|uniref:SusD/RagB family nutrient-binding outer membrane lipoprotein n=2 Tax=Capnocytophaga felis TaxID=2267611 RepID=A0A5M4B6N6_9FLAO|nr:hypothetical protein RCZ01_02270 [Capnocytophaga felis]GET49377.1 hypothetical protein RCZ02_22080 [Capnocytophaga felis]